MEGEEGGTLSAPVAEPRASFLHHFFAEYYAPILLRRGVKLVVVRLGCRWGLGRGCVAHCDPPPPPPGRGVFRCGHCGHGAGQQG